MTYKQTQSLFHVNNNNNDFSIYNNKNVYNNNICINNLNNTIISSNCENIYSQISKQQQKQIQQQIQQQQIQQQQLQQQQLQIQQQQKQQMKQQQKQQQLLQQGCQHNFNTLQQPSQRNVDNFTNHSQTLNTKNLQQVRYHCSAITFNIINAI